MFYYFVAPLYRRKNRKRKQEIQVERDADVALLNAIMLAEWHVAKIGDVKEKFSGAFNMYCASHTITSKLEKRVPKPS